MERWTRNSITHVLQRCWFPGELSPVLCPNPFSTCKGDKCVSGTSPSVFWTGAVATYCSYRLTSEIACRNAKQIHNNTGVMLCAVTVVVNVNIGPGNTHLFVRAVHFSLKWKGGKKTSGLLCDLNVQSPQNALTPPERLRKTFPDIIRRGKAIDLPATVGMPADGIAYNHYSIKYVLKRLGNQRRSKGSTHT